MQGNIVSKNFALRLGFAESDFKQLRPRKRNGGTTATGDILTVEGALNLSWYHGSSSRIFRDMRFLVSSAKDFDMIIGARSITKHNLISPPNLGIVKRASLSDPEDAKLRGEVSKLESSIENLEEVMEEKAKSGKDLKKLEMKSEKQRLELEIMKLRVDKHKAEMKKETAEAKRLQKDIEDLETKQKKSDKKKTKENSDGKKTSAKPNGPDIKVMQPNGKTRTATGDSQRHPKL
ncbi:hypothetical protein K469DRAFT_746012 [Zopfia rhizophila CBS 207.26]|uniref:Uncharacterized protein n=1 Tax=Zopfia rhizophila CBS 207.26 TaxID=1314779 RepID=A0A6A6EPC6_9PEZI|nr:hypothetical protein K469DRAFT_746012 [Zopfia rhizophila CBS 207.26]